MEANTWQMYYFSWQSRKDNFAIKRWRKNENDKLKVTIRGKRQSTSTQKAGVDRPRVVHCVCCSSATNYMWCWSFCFCSDCLCLSGGASNLAPEMIKNENSCKLIVTKKNWTEKLCSVLDENVLYAKLCWSVVLCVVIYAVILTLQTFVI